MILGNGCWSGYSWIFMNIMLLIFMGCIFMMIRLCWKGDFMGCCTRNKAAMNGDANDRSATTKEHSTGEASA
jgi:hypothetical protein